MLHCNTKLIGQPSHASADSDANVLVRGRNCREQTLSQVRQRSYAKDQISQRPRVSIRSKATCAAPLREVLTLCRGLRPHHLQKDRIGSWEVSGLTGAALPQPVRIAKVRSRSR